ncbi:MAG: FAD-dependent oxidoreductase [Hirschia sp.]|nr:FAD-dependent oxidoreductase [Hirschia sp.]MBF19288.1 FAD-dependent oxidoreductase [Hirschia sp.]|tara:strand:+ start:89 stop:1321 length:1233 start_codon:yes stop_codon:yes gene_type:complete
MQTQNCDVAIIGAGPAGSIASALLARKGWNVKVLERQHFPRFSIGESLLPQCIEFIQQAELFDAIDAHGFQFKDGAAFSHKDAYSDIYFPDKSSEGWGTAYQVTRADFDKILIDGSQAKGADVSFGDTVTAFESHADGASLTVQDENGEARRINARFVLDASGFGRVLPRLLDLEAPSNMIKRRSTFCHVKDNITDTKFDRKKILVTVHPEDDKIWYWLIPLANGISSIGVVGADDTMAAIAGDTPTERLNTMLSQSGWMKDILKDAEPVRPALEITGYSANVKSLIGQNYALLGNAAEFLDPVFSSGVTIAMKSASLAAGVLDRQLRGENVDWQADFADELQYGVNAFRACVNAWYDGSLQRIIFYKDKGGNDVTRHVTAILAGYAWDKKNPIVKNPERYIDVIDRLIA